MEIKTRNTYVVYKDGLPVCVGNLIECMEFTGYTKASFYKTVSRSRQGMLKGNNYLIYKVEDEDDKD